MAQQLPDRKAVLYFFIFFQQLSPSKTYGAAIARQKSSSLLFHLRQVLMISKGRDADQLNMFSLFSVKKQQVFMYTKILGSKAKPSINLTTTKKLKILGLTGIVRLHAFTKHKCYEIRQIIIIKIMTAQSKIHYLRSPLRSTSSCLDFIDKYKLGMKILSNA